VGHYDMYVGKKNMNMGKMFMFVPAFFYHK
jgi:hypothetical protein